MCVGVGVGVGVCVCTINFVCVTELQILNHMATSCWIGMLVMSAETILLQFSLSLSVSNLGDRYIPRSRTQ